jgi:hypothetical protein
MAKGNKKAECGELDRILSGCVGKYVPAGSWEIRPREGKTTFVWCRVRPAGGEAAVQRAFADFRAAMKGTEFEGKVTLAFPAE